MVIGGDRAEASIAFRERRAFIDRVWIWKDCWSFLFCLCWIFSLYSCLLSKTNKASINHTIESKLNTAHKNHSPAIGSEMAFNLAIQQQGAKLQDLPKYISKEICWIQAPLHAARDSCSDYIYAYECGNWEGRNHTVSCKLSLSRHIVPKAHTSDLIILNSSTVADSCSVSRFRFGR